MNFKETLELVGIEDKPFFKDQEVSLIFGKNRETISRWRRAGVLKEIVICGKKFITRASLMALIEKGSQ